MRVLIWADGAIHGEDALLLSGTDHGVTVGDGVFETCAVRDGQAFALTRHLRRLERSATGLGIGAPDQELVRRGVAEVLAAAGPADGGRLRITVTAGPGPLGSQRGAGPHTVLIAVGPSVPRGEARLVRVPWVRNERSPVAGLKTTSYAENAVALAAAAARGGDEALLANTRGALCEGTGSNVFVERDGELLTPPLSAGCLAGITRELLLEWAVEDGLPVREAAEEELPWSVLDEAAAGRVGLAVSGSIRNVVAAVSLDGEPVAVGPVTRAAVGLFERRFAEHVDP